MDHWRKLILEERIDVFKEDSIPLQFNWNTPFRSADLGPTLYTASVVVAVLKEASREASKEASKTISIAVKVFKTVYVDINKPELIHKRLLCYKKPTGSTNINLCSILCGIGLPLLRLTLGDVLDDLKNETINVISEPYLFDVFKPFVAKESTKIGLEALQGIANDGIVINILPRELLKLKSYGFAPYAIAKTKANLVGIPMETIPIKPPKGTNTKRIKCWGQNSWNTRWKGLNQCRQTKLWFPQGVRPGISRSIRSLPRLDLGVWIQFLTGHCWLNRHCNVIDPYVDATCRLCGEGEESPEHLWFECNASSIKAFKDRYMTNRSHHLWCFRQVGRFLCVPSIANLFNQGTE